jgi:hypothetical protein
MRTVKFHLLSDPSHPVATVKRQLGRINVGLYCNGCAEFFSIALLPASIAEALARTIEYVSKGPVYCRCPLCGRDQDRQVSEITTVVLGADNQRLTAPAALRW